MSTNEDDGPRLSSWSWLGPFALFMAAFAGFVDPDRGPVKSVLLGAVIVVGAGVSWFWWREQARAERTGLRGR